MSFFRGLCLAILVLLSPSGLARAQTAVDLELVLAVDISRSMDMEEQRLQRQGYIDALGHPAVMQAIQSGFLGRIAIVYVEWGGPIIQDVIVPWTVVEDPASMQTVLDTLAETRLRAVLDTSISEALYFAADLFPDNDIEGSRLVMDVSGDGPNNLGRKVEPARDEVIARGIVINGLPLMIQGANHGPWNIKDLDVYYTDCVIGGPGAFVIPINDFANFAEGVRRKLILEIAGRTPEPQHRIMLAQLTPRDSKMDCLIGEK
ncbi:MAG: DUF1194 domain-containing protein, partial [Pseudomonadota bacterium]